MSSTANVLTSLGAGPFVYTEMMVGDSAIGVLTGKRTKPRIVTAGLRGYYLGLHDEKWSSQVIVPSSTATYYVQIVPICHDLTDTNGDYLKGTPTVENATKGTAFYFLPFPDGYYCTGYEVWAGTTSGTLYYQGELKGRFNNIFTLGVTWPVGSTGDALSAQTIGPPAFAHANEIFQLEGTSNARLFLGGGKKYDDGFAYVPKTSSTAVLTGGTGHSVLATLQAVTCGSFRSKVKRLDSNGNYLDSYVDFQGINLSSASDLAGVASLLQTEWQTYQYPRLICGVPTTTTVATWAAITDGSFDIWASGKLYHVTSMDFSGDSSMSDIATTIQTAMRTAGLGRAIVTYDTTNTKFIIKPMGEAIVTNLIENGTFDTDTLWDKVGGVTISGGHATFPVSAATRSLTQEQTTAYLSGSKWTLTYDISNIGGTNYGFVYAEYKNASAAWIIITNQQISSAGSKTLSIDASSIPYGYESRIRFASSGVSTFGYDLDNVVCAETDPGSKYCSYLYRHSLGTGTDISAMLAGREDSSGVLLNEYSHASNSDTITYDTDHFTITKATSITTASGTNMVATLGSRTLTSAGSSFDSTMIGSLVIVGTDAVAYRIIAVPSATKLTVEPAYAENTGTSLTYKIVADYAQWQIGWLEDCLANDAASTNLAALLDMKSTSTTATYTHGKTANRSLIGQSTAWGEWCEGMKLFVSSEGSSYIVSRYLSADHLYLDSEYDGDALLGYQSYRLQPYSQQIYPSQLGNPFYFSTTDIVQLPTEDSDEITAIGYSNGIIAIYMDHHTWGIDGVDTSTARMIDQTQGCPYVKCVVKMRDRSAIYTGEDFCMMTGNDVQSIDPEKRVKHLIDRENLYADSEPFGVYYHDENTDLVMWWLSIDSSYVPNVALCYEPSSGNWWVYNYKGNTCATVVRDNDKNMYLLSSLPADVGLSIPSFSLTHGEDYKCDGATSESGYDRQGLIGSVGTSTSSAGKLTCAACGALANFTAVTSGYFTLDVDDSTYLVGPINTSACASLAAVAAVIQTAIRAKTGATETCTYDTDHFVITSSTTTDRSVVGYLRSGYNAYTDTDISGKGYMNGREGQGTKTYPVSTLVLNLTDLDGNAAVLYTSNDGEKGVYVFLCDSNYDNGEYARISTNSATQITVTPVPTTTPAAGWHWYIGGIVPSWMKWFDFGSPHHKNKLGGIAITTPQTESSTGNYLTVLGMQDLSSTVRTHKSQQIGSGQDTTNTIKLSDKPATQNGIKIIRPSSDYSLEIDDITVIHAPIV